MKKVDWPLWSTLVLTALVYARVAGFDFVNWDDPVMVLDNPMLTLSFGEGGIHWFTRTIHGDYLPLSMLSFWLQRNVLNLQATGMHLSNVILHLINIAILWRILQYHFRSSYIAWPVLTVFALHPLQVESVAWVSEHKGLLATSFALLSIHALHFQRLKAAMVLFACSLLSKGIIVLLPLMTLLWLRPSSWKLWARRYSAFWLVALVYGIVRLLAYRHNLGSVASINWLDHLAQLPGLWSMLLWHYLKTFLFPWKLSIIYPLPELQWWHLAFSFCMMFGSLYWLVRRPHTLPLFLLAFILMLPIIHVVPRINFANDRYLYMACAVLMLLMLSAFKQLSQRVHVVVALLLLLIFAPLSWMQLERWRDSRTLWQATARELPQHPMVLNNLGLEYLKTSDWTQAIKVFEDALRFDRENIYSHLAMHNLATIYARKESGLYDPKLALQRFEASLHASRRTVDKVQSLYNMALLRLELGEKEEARSLLEQMLELGKGTRDQHLEGFNQRARQLLDKIRF